MGIYDLLYNYLIEHIFNSTSLSTFAEGLGIESNLNQWLAHTSCIVLMVLFIALLILGAVWLFKLVSGFILLKR